MAVDLNDVISGVLRYHGTCLATRRVQVERLLTKMALKARVDAKMCEERRLNGQIENASSGGSVEVLSTPDGKPRHD